jgi:hypothetical protein
VRDAGSQHPAHRGTEDRRHRVAVDEHEWLAGAVLQRAGELPAVPGEAGEDGGEPAGHVAVRAQVSTACAAAEPDVRLGEAQLLQERRDLLDLLGRRRTRVIAAAGAQPRQHGSELDQLARRSVDDKNHLRSRFETMRARPRHMPAPCASA